MMGALADELGADVSERLEEIQGRWNSFGGSIAVQPDEMADAARFVTGTVLFVDGADGDTTDIGSPAEDGR